MLLKKRHIKTRPVKYVNKRPVRTGTVNIAFGYGYGFHNLENVLSYNGRIYRRRHGQFFRYTHGGWAKVRAPYGLKVDNIPHGSRRVRSRLGMLHEFNGTFYLPSRNGAVVVAPPRWSENQNRR